MASLPRSIVVDTEGYGTVELHFSHIVSVDDNYYAIFTCVTPDDGEVVYDAYKLVEVDPDTDEFYEVHRALAAMLGIRKMV